MKIDNNTIKIIDKFPNSNLLQNIEPGSEISANIAKRINSKEAILDMAGNMIRVKFLKGVPKAKNLDLILENKNNNTFSFILLDKTNAQRSIERMLEFSIFNPSDIQEDAIHELSRYIKHIIPSVSAFNLLLMRIKGDNKRLLENRTIDIFNNLLKLGVKSNSLLFMSFLFYLRKGIDIELILFFLTSFKLIDKNFVSDFKKDIKDKERIQQKVQELTQELENQLDKEDGKKIIKETIEWLLEVESSDYKDSYSHEIIYLENEEFKSITYILNKNAVLLSLNLAYIGNLEILIKNVKSTINISFFYENETAANALKKNIDQFQSDLKKIVKKEILIFFYNSKSIKEKIIEIISSLKLNNTLDIKV